MYGEFHSVYRGIGTLNGRDCEFEIGQKPDGDIRLICGSDEFWPECKELALIGIADEVRINAAGKVIRTHAGPGESAAHCYHYRSAGKFELDVGASCWEEARSVRFAITNLVFTGNKREAHGTGGWRRTDLNVKLDGVNISFQKVEEYDSIIDSLKRNKSTKITCELVMEIENHAQDEILEIVDSICSLLTIARGTKINWINYKLLDSDSELICHHCEPRITVPYTSIGLVKSVVIPKCTIDFLTQCYPTYKEHNTKYHFDYVGNFLADIHSRGFPETRCLLLFSVAEVLTRSSFDNNKQLRRLRDFIDKHNVPVQKCIEKKCGRGCGTCVPKCKECKYKCEPKCEIGKFIQDRNEFVHKMRFPDNENITAGYYRNLNFLHRMILSALKFKGELYDWSKGGPVWA